MRVRKYIFYTDSSNDNAVIHITYRADSYELENKQRDFPYKLGLRFMIICDDNAEQITCKIYLIYKSISLTR